MNKQQFLNALRDELCGLPQEDISKSLEYYGEMIDDRIDDGLSEHDAVIGVGTPQEIAKQILMETPMQKLVKAKARPSRVLRTWEIVLLILGSPVWLSLLIAAIIIILSVYIVLWSSVVSLYAVAVSLAAGALVGILAAVAYVCFGRPIPAAVFLGAGLVCAGLTILFFIALSQITKYFVMLSKKIWLAIKSCFIKKGDAQ